MKRAVAVLSCVLVLAEFTCQDSGPHDPPPREAVPATNVTGPVVEVPDIIGVDLAVAVDRLEAAGLEADLSALPKTVRGYASGFQTHPRVWVTKMDPPPGTEVEPGTAVAVLEAECPRRNERVC